MDNVIPILLKKIIPELKIATGLQVYTRMPKSVSSTYPYIYISEIYQTEDGAKDYYVYTVDLLVQVIYKDITSIIEFHETIDKVLSLINNFGCTQIEEPHKLLSCRLDNVSTTEFQGDDGIMTIAPIRVIFMIQ